MAEMRYEVRDETAEALLKEIGLILKNVCPPGYGFNLMIFNFGERGNVFYASNADRVDMIRIMQDFIDRFGAKPN
jgi:hypothetical protein